MEQAQFDELVHRLEGYAARNPAGYRLRVSLLAVLGYAYIFMVLAALLALNAGIIYSVLVKHHTIVLLKIGIPALIVTVLVLRALWVRISPPQGMPITRQQAPKLFDLLENIRQELNAPKIHCVLLTQEFNAAISQVPRLGIFGWQKNYLIIGLPLMQSLSPKEFSAVLGHEYGHLSGAHGKFGAWIYRVRKTGNQLMNSLQADGGSILFNRFFNWYIPFFSAYSFVFARQNEYEADACAAKIAGRQHAAQALVNVEIKANLNNKFWDKIYTLATEIPNLPAPYASLQDVLKERLDDNLAHEWLRRSLLRPTDTVDTHPSLQDRLKALGETPQLPTKIPEKNAASYFLQEYLDTVLQRFDGQWQQNIAERWQERFEFGQQAKARLQVLASQASLTTDELWEQAKLYEEVATSSALTLEAYQQVMQQDPARADAAQFAIGRLMLQQSQSEGVALLQELLSKNANWTIEICNVLANYAHEQGEFAQAKIYQAQMNERIALEVAARAERSDINVKDKLLEHALNSVQIHEIMLQLEPWIKKIKRVYLVQKQVQYFPERVFYVLAVQHRFQLLSSEKYRTQFLQDIANHVELPSGFMVMSDWGNSAPIFKKVKKVPNALIYPFK
ncbi:MAG: M48 family metallopeptidase [Thiotrichaceae bacterium]|nr:M48 family metallopeptidase [Thiotrichaceae bacterium]